ncbi:MAG: transcriptional regulator [Candidatus Dadabacteria bacterium]|nr:transcriptional regulator [Candidatus Dadabacteria bacterium]MYE61515.1 transcriptional regulator [Candidatus Dadabacteria bacterium]
MALTRDFRDTVMERARKDPEFRIGLLTEAIECVINDEINVAKELLRDYVNATIGFQELGTLTKKDPKSLMRMLGPKGNPSLKNISSLLASLKESEGVKLHVQALG